MGESVPAGDGSARGAAAWSTVLGALVVVVGFVRGLERLHDNSFLTHLATGRLIVADGIPRADPYSFTADGEPWVVQSWLVSWIFARVEDLAGLDGIRVLVALLTAALVGALWVATAGSRSLVTRLVVTVLALAALLPHVAERPLMVGLLGVALTVLAVDGRLDPRWLVPMGWVWVSSHGSFPLGLAVAGCALVGSILDRSPWRTEARALCWVAVGVVLGAANPLGPRLLWFPVELLGRTDLLRTYVVEWKPFSLDISGAYAAVALVLLAAWGLVRRPSWRDAGLVVIFCAAAATSRRNIPVAILVVAPVVARSLPAWGSIRAAQPLAVGRAALGAVAAGGALAAVVALGQPSTALGGYPVDLVDVLEEAGAWDADADVRIATEDFVGNYLTARFGPDARVFLDDRYDMYPEAVLEDYLVLSRGEGDAGQVAILDRYGVDVVLWRDDRPLQEWMATAPGWMDGPADERFWIACRVGSVAAETVCGR